MLYIWKGSLINYVFFIHFVEVSDRSTVFTTSVCPAVFGWFSANSGSHIIREHANFTTAPDFLHGTRKELFMFLIKQFSLPAATILDMTDSEGRIRVYTLTIIPFIFNRGLISGGHTVWKKSNLCTKE